MGQLPDQRRQLEHELKLLLPYRVLDLISRDLSALTARQEGIRLLEQLVLQRGGLEGELDPDFSQDEFQPFFKQIRQFLTVQEQVDLFSRWADAGSATADFLASFALTAAGFVQRKPERIQAGFQRLQASGQAGMEVFLPAAAARPGRAGANPVRCRRRRGPAPVGPGAKQRPPGAPVRLLPRLAEP